MDPGTRPPNPRSPRGMHPPSRPADPGGHQHSGRHMRHTPLVPLPRTTGGPQHWGGGPPTATLPKHTFVIPASGPPRQLHVRRRRFRARPSRHHSGPKAPGTTPLLPTPTTPLGTGTPPVPDGTGRDAHYYIVNILLTIFQ